MSIPLLIYWILAKMILAVDTAPFRNGILDAFMSSVETSASYLSNEMVVPILRKDISPEEIRELSGGYIFNENVCIQFNTRILCGYDKNKGHKIDDYTIIDMGNGCRSRGDRLECGYENGQFSKHLRRPNVEHGAHNEQRDNQHGDEHQNNLARQAPTGTSMTMTPNSQSEFIILNKIKSDFLENKLLKSAFDKLLMKNEDTRGVITTTDLSNPVKFSTDTLKPLSTTVKILTKSVSTPISSTPTTFTPPSSTPTTSTPPSSTPTTSTPPSSTPTPESIQMSESTKTEATTTVSPTEITSLTSTQAAESSESNDISSDAEAIKRIVKLAVDSDQKVAPAQKSRRLTEMLSKLVIKSKPDLITTVPPIVNSCETTTNSVDLRMKTNSGEKITTACVEKQDTVVCYDFKT